jgi:hypothetical protein
LALGKLNALQERLLVVLAGVDPPWTLSGGAALAGFYTAHRETRDLDLFWQRQHVLGDSLESVLRMLNAAGLETKVLQTSDAFSRLSVQDGGAAVVVDLVASPVPLAEAPRRMTAGGAAFLVDTPHQILVNKLCALLGRSELRDLEDIKALLESGGDLSRALDACPPQDAGFSPLTLAWTARALPVDRLAAALGWSIERREALEHFRDELVDRLVQAARPE